MERAGCCIALRSKASKATKAAFAVGCVLNNRRVGTVVRRIVLLAVIRPIVEYASTVWDAWAGAAGTSANACAAMGVAGTGHSS
jgi:hypothetical protein